MMRRESSPTIPSMTDSSVPPRTLDESRKWGDRSEKVIPSGSQTFSKGPSQFVRGVAPMFIARGEGSHVWDVDGNEYIDYPMALGPVLLGYNNPVVNDAVVRQLRDGTLFSLPHPLEVEVAEKLTKLIPCAEMVRFGKNGSDATSGAVRVARAFTDRDIIACCGYHGWQDWYIGTTTRNKGVPAAVSALTQPFSYNDIDSLKAIFREHSGQVAAVIMEPIGVVEPKDQFLQHVQEICRQERALLIFDEVVSGFRLSLGGAQEYFSVVPDMACFGKGMANGFPLSAIVGRREIMGLFDEVFFSFTFAGETLSLAAANATLNEMQTKPVIPHLWDQGCALKEGCNQLVEKHALSANVACVGLAPRTVMTFKDLSGSESLVLKSLFQQECLKRGILFGGGHNISYSHSQADIARTLSVYDTALAILADALRSGDANERLQGPPIQPVFRRA